MVREDNTVEVSMHHQQVLVYRICVAYYQV